MKRAILLACIAAILLASFIPAAYAAVAGYAEKTTFTYTGAATDRGVAVNKNPNSSYYGYFYACDDTTGAPCIHILAPDSNSVAATSYTEVGTLSAGTARFFNCYITSDDTVWAVDYPNNKVYYGDPAGGTLVQLPFSTAQKPRALWVVGGLTADKSGVQIGTKIYVAESTWGSGGNFLDDAEIFEYQESGWFRVAELGTDLAAFGLLHIYGIAVDNAGNSYWLSNHNGYSTALAGPVPGFQYMAKVKADYTIDTSFSLNIPSGFLNKADGTPTYTWLPTCVVYINDQYDGDYAEHIYVSANDAYLTYPIYNNDVLRFDLNGNYVDGWGMAYWLPTTNGYPTGTYSGIVIRQAPSGNRNPWMTVDDKHNVYLLCSPDSTGAGTTAPTTGIIKKVHRMLQIPPAAPTNVTASNDIYGQIKMAWTTPVAGTTTGTYSGDGAVTSMRIYKSTDTTKPDTAYGVCTDLYPKWKDVVQGQTAGGPFYYWISGVSGSMEGAITGPIGPVSTSTSTAPADWSKTGIALAWNEYATGDAEGSPSGFYTYMSNFLTRRGVAFSKVFDADTSGENIENDDLAGYTLAFFDCNRDMSSYEAQCIKDYVKYSKGRVIGSYWCSTANNSKTSVGSMQLADIFRVSSIGWHADSAASAWNLYTCRYMQKTTETGADTLFDGLPSTGVVQPDSTPITWVVSPYTDGTAKTLGVWCNINGDGPYPTIPAQNAAAVAGYYNDEPRSLYFGNMWWYRMPESTGSTNTHPTCTQMVENSLKFFGIPINTVVGGGANLGKYLGLSDGKSGYFEDLVVTNVYSNNVFVDTTGAFYDDYYVETKDRTAAIKLRITHDDWSDPYFTPGDVITVSGQMGSETQTATIGGSSVSLIGDRIFKAWEYTKTDETYDLKPLCMQNKDIVGIYDSPQQGIIGGTGLNNLCQYVKTTGKVTYIADETGYISYFYIDDGSNLKDGTTHLDDQNNSVDNVGIRVVFPIIDTINSPYVSPSYFPQLSLGATVSVTGCTTLALVGEIGSQGAVTTGGTTKYTGLRAIRISADSSENSITSY